MSIRDPKYETLSPDALQQLQLERLQALLVRLTKHSGRNFHGKITVRHRGGGSRTLYRIIDFKRDKDNIPGIPGVGEVTARKLLQEYDSVEAILHDAEGALELAKSNRRKMLQSLRTKTLGAATDIPTSPFLG